MTVKVKDNSRKTKSRIGRTHEGSALGCTHFWIIEKPSGPTSRGVCKYCGAVGEFVNEPLSLFYPGMSLQEGIFNPGEDGDDGLNLIG